MSSSTVDRKLYSYAAATIVIGSFALYVFMPSFWGKSGSDYPEGSAGTGFSRNSRYVVGLRNEANDCFANSDLQALSSSPSLRAYLADPRFKDLLLTESLNRMIQELNSPIVRPKAISPWPFLHVLESIFKARISRRQHDAHELLHLILQTIADEHEKKVKSMAGSIDEPTSEAGSSIREYLPFEGSTTDVIRCLECGNLSPPRTTDFIVLTLNVPQRSSTTLEECLATLFRSEVISDYGCVQCRLRALAQIVAQRAYAPAEAIECSIKQPDSVQRRKSTAEEEPPDYREDPAGYISYLQRCDPNAELHPTIESQLPKQIKSKISRSTSLGVLPSMLILHLSRSIFSHTATRNSCRVKFPEFLTLTTQGSGPDAMKELIKQLNSSYESKETSIGSSSSKTYRLASMIRHLGTHSAGHYECYRRKEMFKDYEAESKRDKAYEAILAADNVSSISSEAEVGTDLKPDLDAQKLDAGAQEREAARLSRKLFRQFTGPKEWWRISDDKVWECTMEEVLKQTPYVYMLVYEEIDLEDKKMSVKYRNMKL
ncbi:uncharacterized protein V1516DRAFT_665416 [Lipomyces oligophaga]|uniref:uncharacterized protein n=1 Tax=Lipomyces oligophaga TaxID=45792 RepID=UPI0034CFD59C